MHVKKAQNSLRILISAFDFYSLEIITLPGRRKQVSSRGGPVSL